MWNFTQWMWNVRFRFRFTFCNQNVKVLWLKCNFSSLQFRHVKWKMNHIYVTVMPIHLLFLKSSEWHNIRSTWIDSRFTKLWLPESHMWRNKNVTFGHRCNCDNLGVTVTSHRLSVLLGMQIPSYSLKIRSKVWRLWNVWSFKYLIVMVDTFESWPINKTIWRSFFPHPPYPIDNARNRNPRVSFRPQIDILAACLRDLC